MKVRGQSEVGMDANGEDVEIAIEYFESMELDIRQCPLCYVTKHLHS